MDSKLSYSELEFAVFRRKIFDLLDYKGCNISTVQILTNLRSKASTLKHKTQTRLGLNSLGIFLLFCITFFTLHFGSYQQHMFSMLLMS